MSRTGKTFLGLFLCALAAGGAALWLFSSAALEAPGPLEADKLVYIAPHSSTGTIAEALQNAQVIDNPLFFRYGAHLKRAEGPLKAGEYNFKAHISAAAAIALLQSGKVYQHQLTIPEGLTAFEITGLVNAAPALNGNIETIPAEGTLLPETYNYTYGETRAALVDRMAKNMSATLASLWKTHAPGILLKSPQEAVTLASIVEKETGIASERPRIAGVFMNRLRTNMPLQSDPTVIYAVTMGKMKLDRPISRADLDLSSPYNTYRVPGLPPGPIANPGRASLEAVMNPEANSFLYFVADGSGGHAFSKTLEEHLANVARWRALPKKPAAPSHVPAPAPIPASAAPAQ